MINSTPAYFRARRMHGKGFSEQERAHTMVGLEISWQQDAHPPGEKIGVVSLDTATTDFR